MSDPVPVKSDTTSVAAAAVAIKPPVFDETAVARWFSIIESQFILANITVSSTKFHHVLSNLPVRVLNQVNDDVIQSACYDKLKTALTNLFSQSKPELFDSLVTQNQITFTKPTQYLRELRKIATPLALGEDFLRIKFIKALPNNIRPIIATYDTSTSLEELARVSDTLMSYNVTCGAQVNQVYTSRPSYSHRDPTGGNMTVNYVHSSIPVGVRAFHDKQRPRVCRYHLYYGQNAKSCKPWCMLSSSKVGLNMLPSSRRPSRSSSPSRSPSRPGTNQPLLDFSEN